MYMRIKNVKVTSQMNAEMSIYKIEETRGAKQVLKGGGKEQEAEFSSRIPNSSKSVSRVSVLSPNPTD